MDEWVSDSLQIWWRMGRIMHRTDLSILLVYRGENCLGDPKKKGQKTERRWIEEVYNRDWRVIERLPTICCAFPWTATTEWLNLILESVSAYQQSERSHLFYDCAEWQEDNFPWQPTVPKERKWAQSRWSEKEQDRNIWDEDSGSREVGERTMVENTKQQASSSKTLKYCTCDRCDKFILLVILILWYVG